jgi:hypothetical protein
MNEHEGLDLSMKSNEQVYAALATLQFLPLALAS